MCKWCAHTAGAMAPTDIRRRVISEWLTQVQGERTQADFAEDVTRTTGWNLDRTRLGRYQNQRLPVGREVIEHLTDYANVKGIPAPDFTPQDAPPSFEERQLALLERQTIATEAQAEAAKAQTVALNAILEELRAAKGVQRGNAEGVVSALADLAREVAARPSARGTGTGAAGR